jgi:hypothetical protein
MTPQQRSIKWLRDDGWLVATVESWKRFPDFRKGACKCCHQTPMVQLRQDLWGFADLLALSPNGSHYLVQVTDGSNHAKRMVKIMNDPEAAPHALRALKFGMKILVMSWALGGPRGERKTYKMRMEEVTEDMISVPNKAMVAAEDF